MKDLQIRRYYREQFCDREPEIVTEFFITNSYPQPQNLIGTVTDEYSELIFKQIMRNESQIMTLLYKDETDDDLIPLYLMNYLQEDFCTQDFKIVHSPVAFPIQAKEKIIQDYLARIEIFNSNFICFSVFYHPKLDESELIFCTDGTAAKNELLKHLQNALTSKSRLNEIKVSAYKENIIKFTLYYKAGFIEEYYLNNKILKEGGYFHG